MEQKTPISDPLNRANKAHPPSAFLLLPTAFLPSYSSSKILVIITIHSLGRPVGIGSDQSFGSA